MSRYLPPVLVNLNKRPVFVSGPNIQIKAAAAPAAVQWQ